MRHALMVSATIATALLLAPAAQAREVRCTLKYNMEGGGAFY